MITVVFAPNLTRRIPLAIGRDLVHSILAAKRA